MGRNLVWMDVPEGWKSDKAKYIFRQMNRPVRDEDEIVTAFRDGTVTLRSNRRTDGFTNSLKEIGYQGVRKGDLVIHAMDGFAGAIGVSDSDGKSTPVYSVCQPIIPANNYYYAYLIRFLALNGYIESLARGIRERSTEFRFKEFRELELPIPPIHVQNSIVNFLDAKVAKINSLISKYLRMIELLEERRSCIICQTVTKGLHISAPLKKTGVNWLGEIPSHWDLVKLKRIASLKSGEGITIESINSDSEFPVYGGNGLRGYTSTYTHSGHFVLIGRQGALCGNINYADGKFWASEHAVVVSPIKHINTVWLGELLRAANLNQYSISAAQPGISVERICQILIPFPPLKEQDEIASFLISKTTKIDKAIEKYRLLVTTQPVMVSDKKII